MTDDAPAPGGTEQVPEAPQSLESLYQEYGIAAQPQAHAPSTPQPQPPAASEPVPDANDPEAMLRWSMAQNAQVQADVSALRQTVVSERQEAYRAREERDFGTAVAQLAQEAGAGDDQRDIVEGILLARARNDERLQQLWQQRADKPEAWTKALKVLGQQVKGKLAVQVDPDIAANQRALDESQRAQSSMAPPQSTPEEDVAKMNPAEFDHWWARATGRGR